MLVPADAVRDFVKANGVNAAGTVDDAKAAMVRVICVGSSSTRLPPRAASVLAHGANRVGPTSPPKLLTWINASRALIGASTHRDHARYSGTSDHAG